MHRNAVVLLLIPAIGTAFLFLNARLAARGREHRDREPSSTVAATALVLLATLVALLTPTAAGAVVHRAGTGSSGEYVSLLFSRTEMGAADGCVPDGDGIATLGGDVAPWLQSQGLAATGSLVTGRTQDTTETCTHGNDSLTASWADATGLAQAYGWSFVSATQTYPGPAKLASLTPLQSWQQTCGSAQAIQAHGLAGATGMIDYPGVTAKSPAVAQLQADYGANCFSWGRMYSKTGVTDATAGVTAPFWQSTRAVLGGPCSDPLAACYGLLVTGSKRYTDPASVVAQIGLLQPGQWFTLQAYVLVTGTSPAYTQDTGQWDCTSPDPAEHWSNDVERYCYSDWQQIVSAVAVMQQAGTLTVTDPGTVGVDFGRPSSYGMAKPSAAARTGR